MNRQLLWDDLRIVLAIAEAGSLSGAGRRLELSHATVFRRLGDIEARVGVKFFERTRTGYSPTPAGEEVAAGARRVEAEVLDIERRVAGRDLRPSGTVRLTTTDALLSGVLSPIFAEFRRTFPDISLEVAVPSQLFNLSRREADIAIRPSSTPPENLVGRKVGRIAQAIYAKKDLKRDVRDLHADWIGPDESMAYRVLDAWMETEGLNDRCRYRVDTTLGMLAAARAGLGLAVLPCYLADNDSALTRLGEPLPALSVDLWLLTHPDLRNTARIRAVMEFVANGLKDCRARLEGAVR